MAYNFTDAVFSLKGLQPTDKLVLLHLAEHADKDAGECWPGFGRLADFTGLNRSSVIRSINRLEQLECITIAPPTGDRKTNTYTVQMDKLVAASVTPAAKAPRKYERTGKYRKVTTPDHGEGIEFFDITAPDDDEKIEFFDEYNMA